MFWFQLRVINEILKYLHSNYTFLAHVLACAYIAQLIALLLLWKLCPICDFYAELCANTQIRKSCRLNNWYAKSRNRKTKLILRAISLHWLRQATNDETLKTNCSTEFIKSFFLQSQVFVTLTCLSCQ